MKLLVLITAISLSTTACFAESKPQSKKTWSTIEIAEPHQYHCLREYDRWGLIDQTGNVKPLPESGVPILDDERSWIAIKVRTAQNNRFVRKLIGPNGQFIPRSNEVEIVNFLEENRAPVKFIPDVKSQSKQLATEHVAYSFCTETGEILRNRFDQVSPFNNGTAAVRIGNLVGFIGLDGQFLLNSKRVECQFQEGLSEDCLPAYKDGRWGYLNTSGDWLVQPVYLSAGPFKNGMALVSFRTSTQNAVPTIEFSYIDKHGKLLNQRFHSARSFDTQGYAAASVLLAKQNSKPLWGLIDKSGQWVLQAKYSRVDPLIGSARLIKENGLVGVWSNGKVTVAPKYVRIGRFSEGLASFRSRDSDKVGFIDPEGKIVIAAQFDSAGAFSEGYAAVGYATAADSNSESKIGFIDKKGVLKIPPKFGGSSLWQIENNPFLIQFRNGLCLVSGHSVSDGKVLRTGYGYINRHGEWISPVVMTEAFPFSMGRALIKYFPISGK